METHLPGRWWVLGFIPGMCRELISPSLHHVRHRNTINSGLLKMKGAFWDRTPNHGQNFQEDSTMAGQLPSTFKSAPTQLRRSRPCWSSLSFWHLLWLVDKICHCGQVWEVEFFSSIGEPHPNRRSELSDILRWHMMFCWGFAFLGGHKAWGMHRLTETDGGSGNLRPHWCV